MIPALPARLAGLSRWKRHALSFAVGLIATGAFAPFGWWFLLIPSLGGLFLLLCTAARPRHAAANAWWWGFGHYLTSLYWIAISMLVDPERFAWMIPFAVSLIPAACACYLALAGWMFARRPAKLPAVLAFAALLTASEWLRGHLFTGFPWNTLGYAVSGWLPLLQLAWPLGLWGTTFGLVLLCVLPASALLLPSRRWVPLALCAFGFAGAWGHGHWRLTHTDVADLPGVRVRLVQASIPQSLKWDPSLATQHLRAYYDLTRGPGFQQVTHVIWPESAVPFTLRGNASWLEWIRDAIPPQGALVTGVVRETVDDTGRRLYNSVAALRSDGTVSGTYDKIRLVPFGEFVPLRGILPIDKLTPGMADFSRGANPGPVEIPGIGPASMLLCYEAIFPLPEQAASARILISTTNDGWFGDSSGPYQHFEMARFRAVEGGIPLLRAANNGISGIIDPLGRTISTLGHDSVGVLDGTVPVIR